MFVDCVHSRETDEQTVPDFNVATVQRVFYRPNDGERGVVITGTCVGRLLLLARI
jgi:hypothetical protein